jgi:hypothetical protein
MREEFAKHIRSLLAARVDGTASDAARCVKQRIATPKSAI